MGGREQEPLYPAEKINVGDLVYRYKSEREPEKHYSDDYTKRLAEERRKQMNQLMDALERLGMLNEVGPKGMVPAVPYRMVEPTIGF